MGDTRTLDHSSYVLFGGPAQTLQVETGMFEEPPNMG